MGSLGAMAQRTARPTATSRTPPTSREARARGHRRPRAVQGQPASRSSTSWSAACAPRWATRGCRDIDGACAPSRSSCASPAPAVRESHVHDVTITKEAPNYRRVSLAAAASEASHHAWPDASPSEVLDPRLRRAVHAADRAPRARARRLLRDPAVGHADAEDRGASRRRGIILSGGPESVDACGLAAARRCGVSTCGVPVLGICYGMQTMAQQLGGGVESSDASRVRLRRRCSVAAQRSAAEGLREATSADARRLDEPRRPRRRAAAGLRRHRVDRRPRRSRRWPT